MNTVRVQFGIQEDARRAVLDVLDREARDMSAREQSRLAGVLVAALRDAGLLQQSVEQHYNASQVAQLICRSPKYVGLQARAGRFPGAKLDDGGWLIPASAVQRWLDARLFLAEQRKEVAA